MGLSPTQVLFFIKKERDMPDEREKLVAEQLAELKEIWEDKAFTDIIFAKRVTPPEPNQKVSVYKKRRLRIDNIEKFLPAERVVHHNNGDVTYILSNRGALRFLNMQKRIDELIEILAVVHE